MSEKQAWRSWAIVFALLVVFAIVTAVWSAIAPSLGLPQIGGGTDVPSAPPPEIEPIDLSFLGIEQALSPFLALVALAGIVVVLIAGTGLAIGFINLLLSRSVETVKESDEEFDPQQSNPVARLIYSLNDSVLSRIRGWKEGQFDDRTTMGKPEEAVMPRWSVISTALIILMFVSFFGMIVSATFFPEGEIIMGGNIFNPNTFVVGGMLLVTIIALAVWLRPETVLSSEKDQAAIPWDSIAVLVTGLVVVGLALGAMVYLLGL